MAIGRRIGAWLGYWTGVRVVAVGRRIGSWIGYWQEMPPIHHLAPRERTFGVPNQRRRFGVPRQERRFPVPKQRRRFEVK
jgi:hypothetical protein